MDDKKVLLTIARLSPEKRVNVLIESMEMFIKKFKDLRLLIIGNGPLKDALYNMVEMNNLSNYIQSVELKNENEIKYFYNLCDVFVLTSLIETFGIVLVEAMSCSKAVCVTMVGGIPEVVINGENGILVPPNDKESLADGIIKLLSFSEEKRKKMGLKGKERTKKLFSLHNMVNSYKNLYESLMNKPG